jgi:hypothetical protein
MYIGLFGDIKHDFHVTPMSQRQNCQRLGPIKNKERKKKKSDKKLAYIQRVAILLLHESGA